MRVSQSGEFGLIHSLAGIIQAGRDERAPAWRRLVLGIGDDAAAWRCEPGLTLATSDCLIEGVHFTRATIGWRDLGWKALAVNLSDIAAMGGAPRYALVTLALPEDTDEQAAAELYQGMAELANRYGVAVVGGDTSAAPAVFINLTVTGAGEQLLTRSAAKPGDRVAVTGCLGMAAAGWQLLKEGGEIPQEADPLLSAFRHPIPRLEAGRLLVQAGVQAAIDVSDGLAADLGHICEMSRAGADVSVDRVPVHPAARALLGAAALPLALGGGEDYELLFTAPAETIKQVQAQSPVPVTVVGEITSAHPGQVRLLDAAGRPFTLPERGWQHFVSR